MASRRSTIATQVGGVNVVRPMASTPVSTHKPTFTTSQVEDSARLTRKLNELTHWVGQSTDAARTSPFSSVVIIRNIALTNGSTSTVAHMLGREPNGWICVRAQTASFIGYETSLAAGLDRTKYIAIAAGSTGTYDLMVF